MGPQPAETGGVLCVGLFLIASTVEESSLQSRSEKSDDFFDVWQLRVKSLPTPANITEGLGWPEVNDLGELGWPRARR